MKWSTPRFFGCRCFAAILVLFMGGTLSPVLFAGSFLETLESTAESGDVSVDLAPASASDIADQVLGAEGSSVSKAPRLDSAKQNSVFSSLDNISTQSENNPCHATSEFKQLLLFSSSTRSAHYSAYNRMLGLTLLSPDFTTAVAAYNQAYQAYLASLRSEAENNPGNTSNPRLDPASIANYKTQFLSAYNAMQSNQPDDPEYAKYKDKYTTAYNDYIAALRGYQTSDTRTSTATSSGTSTLTASSTATSTQTATGSITLTGTGSSTLTSTGTGSATGTTTGTGTSTSTLTGTRTSTSTATGTKTLTATGTSTITGAATGTITTTGTNTITLTSTATNTSTNTTTGTQTSTSTGTATTTADLMSEIKRKYGITVSDGKMSSGHLNGGIWGTGTWALEELTTLKEILEILPASFTCHTESLTRYSTFYEPSYDPVAAHEGFAGSGSVHIYLSDYAFDYNQTEVKHDGPDGKDTIIGEMGIGFYKSLTWMGDPTYYPIKNDWENTFWPNRKQKSPSVPDGNRRSGKDAEWDMVESIVFYVLHASSMKANFPDRYEFIRTRIMGREF
ncbi:MAG: hypothetical protein WA705_14420 [Candidatus Ozemobacteraceae bacterium]